MALCPTLKVIKLSRGDFLLITLETLKKINKINSSELIDEGIILWFPGPGSYTGEDMAEFHIHGSKAVIDGSARFYFTSGKLSFSRTRVNLQSLHFKMEK